MQKVLFVAAVVMTGALFAREPKTYIWPEGKMPYADQKHQIAAMTDEASKKGFNRDEWRRPYIEWCDAPAASNKTDTCVILISGGGYGNCCDVGLIKRWEKALTERGVTCVNFVYRTPRPKGLPIWQTAWADGQRAVRMVRAEAAKRGFSPDKIGTFSMSAGSHLATLLATSSLTPAYEPVDDLDKEPCNINFACPFAIAYAVSDGVGTPNTRDGYAPDAKLDKVFKFDEKTPPMCMMHGGKDIFSSGASTLVYRELRKRNIPAELHLYSDKPHGAFGDGRAFEFMLQTGFLGELPAKVAEPQYTGAYTAQRKVVELWPKGRIPSNVKKFKRTPTLEWFIPSNITTKAIQVILPGGAYNFCNIGGEGMPAAEYFNARGMAVVIVDYRTPRAGGDLAKHTVAWQDAQRAIRVVRRDAKSFGLDPDRIGVMGFSAGGHLTLMTALSSKSRAYWPIDDTDKISCKVQWALPVYPAYVLSDGVDGGNKTRGNGEGVTIVPDFAFDLDSPPMCFVHGDADGISAMGSVMVWERLRAMGIQCDLHTLALRDHCFQFKASPGTGSATWKDRLWDFLTHKGFNR